MMDDILKKLAEAAVDTAIDSAKKVAGKVVDGALDSATERGRPKQYCIRCGHELPPNARFCKDCGAEQRGASISELRSQTGAAPQVRLDPAPLPPTPAAQLHAPFMMPVQLVVVKPRSLSPVAHRPVARL
jgi:ribosomal protein L40E